MVEALEPRQLFDGTPIISEFLAGNSGGLRDADGDSSDWIELYNPSAAAIDLEGWSLTDDPGDLREWVFPAVSLDAHSFLTIFASDKNRTGAELHTNFKLSADGEYLALVDPAGVAVSEFTPSFPGQYDNISYGALFTGSDAHPDQPRFFPTPTPGAINVNPALGVLDRVTASIAAGFYDNPFAVELSTVSAGATIRYTTDGSLPTTTNGDIYSGPITIAATTTLRAGAFRENYVSLPSITRSYLFLDDVIVQSPSDDTPGGNPAVGAAPPGWPATWGDNAVDYGIDQTIVNQAGAENIKAALLAISSLSITTDLANLFDPTTGIYANAIEDGREWEREASVELLNPDGSAGFQVNAGLRIRGGFSRIDSNPKHSLRVFMRGEYGDSTLEYPLFGDAGVDSFEKFDLRTAQNFSWSYVGWPGNTMLQDGFVREMQGEMGGAYTRSKWVHLYLDGQYWGLYQIEERPEAEYAASYFGGDPDDYDVIKPEVGPYANEATDGNQDAYHRLWEFVTTRNLSDSGVYYHLQGKDAAGAPDPSIPDADVLVDVDNLIVYMLGTLHGGNLDGPITIAFDNTRVNNYFALRDRTGRSGFKFIQHDAEHTLQDVNVDRNGPYPAGQLFEYFNPQFLHQQLMANAEYRLRFADLMQRFFLDDGPITAANAAARFEADAAEIQQAILGESARWGDAQRPTNPLGWTDWRNAVDVMKGFLEQRNPILLGQFRSNGLYPSLAAPEFLVNGAANSGGEVVPDSILQFSAAGTVYYTTDGSDPRLIGGGISPTTLVYEPSHPLILNGVTDFRARTRSGADWSALSAAKFTAAVEPAAAGNLVITEIHYNPAPMSGSPAAPLNDAQNFEFLEFRSKSNRILDLTGVNFTNGITFDFTTGGIRFLAAGQSLVLVKNRTAFEARYGTAGRIGGVYSGSLDNGGERLRYVGANGAVIQDFTYDDNGAVSPPWPVTPDGGGPSLTVRNVNGNYNSAANWRASDLTHGTPGYEEHEAPTSLSLTNGSVVENIAHAVAGTLSATDPNTNDTLTFSLVDNAGGRFAVVGSQLVVANHVTLDYETQTSYDVTVRVTDAGGLSLERTFTIQVIDVYEPDGLVSLTADDAVATERPTNTARLTVTLAMPTPPTVDLVVYYSVDGTATAGTDYAALSGSVTIPVGQTSATIDIAGIVDDRFAEGLETVIVTLTGTNTADIIPSDTNSPVVKLLDNDQTYAYESESQFGHVIGRVEVDGWSASAALDQANYLSFGPYTADIGPGVYHASFRLRVDGQGPADAAVATIDVWDFRLGRLAVSRIVRRGDFTTAGVYQDFELLFDVTAEDSQFEFRTFWHDGFDLRQDHVRIVPAGTWFETETQFGHRVGRAEVDGWSATAGTDPPEYLSFGPYTAAFRAGRYDAGFRLAVTGGDPLANVATIDIYDARSGRQLARRVLRRAEFAADGVYQAFDLPFELTTNDSLLEFRTYWHGAVSLRQDGVSVTPHAVQVFEAETHLVHRVGRAEADGWSASVALDAAEYLSFGPFTDAMPQGSHAATFRLLVSGTGNLGLDIAEIDVWDGVAGRVLARRRLRREDFAAANVYQNFVLPFELTAHDSRLEFRTYWYDTFNLRQDSVTVAPFAPLNYESELDFGHRIGHVAADGWAAATATDDADYLSFGPYTTEITVGLRRAMFRLQVNGAAAAGAVVATIDVVNVANGKTLARRPISFGEFAAAGVYQDFALAFYSPGNGTALEFRTLWHDVVDLRQDRVRIAEDQPLRFESERDFSHHTGHSDGGGWSASTQQDHAEYMAFGPYTSDLEPGIHAAGFRLQVTGRAPFDAVVATLDVRDAHSGVVLARREVRRADFASAGVDQDFVLPFEVRDDDSLLEFRTFWHAVANLRQDRVEIMPYRGSQYEAESDLFHFVGRATPDGWGATPATESEGVLAYGPYVTFQPGSRVANFWLSAAGGVPADAVVAIIDVWDIRSNRALARREIRRGEFSAENDYQPFTLRFEVPAEPSLLEFRTYWTDLTELQLDRVTTFRDTADLDALDEIFSLPE